MDRNILEKLLDDVIEAAREVDAAYANGGGLARAAKQLFATRRALIDWVAEQITEAKFGSET